LANVPKSFDHNAKKIIMVSLINFEMGAENTVNIIIVFRQQCMEECVGI